MKVSTSILSIKENLQENLEKLDNSNTDYIHLDIMDGEFVLNKTWNYCFIRDLVQNIKKPLDVHLMVNDLNNYIKDFSNLQPKYITFHLEATKNVNDYINLIKSKGIKVGLSIKPNTDIDLLIPYLNLIDLVLVMSVEPGAGGQQFIESSCLKIERLKELKNINNYNYVIEVDGGINQNTIAKVKEAGADIVVSGSFVTSCSDFESRISLLK